MKTIVFGGAFDPVHSEHISLAAAAVKELGAEKLVLVPTFSPGHKSNAEASFSDRVEMLKLAFSDFPVQTEISDVERISGKTNFAFEILPLIEKSTAQRSISWAATVWSIFHVAPSRKDSGADDAGCRSERRL